MKNIRSTILCSVLMASAMLLWTGLTSNEVWARAPSVFINGVQVDGLRGQVIERAKVRFDEQGNVHIEAPGYHVKSTESPSTPPSSQSWQGQQRQAHAPHSPSPGSGSGSGVATGTAAPRGVGVQAPPAAPQRVMMGRYWLVVNRGGQQSPQYNIDVMVNGQLVRRIRHTDTDMVVEITRNLSPGRNVIRIRAQKDVSQGRLSHSPSDSVTITIGSGNERSGRVVIEQSLIHYRRTALETSSFDNEYVLNI